LHPVAEVAQMVRKTNALFVVDAVSSLGSLDFQMDNWGIDVCFSASQKCLGCPPGLAMVAINDRAFAFFSDNQENISGWYLNPLIWRWHQQNWKWHPYPTSLPTPVFVTMQKSLNRLIDKGLNKHYDQHAKAAAAIRKGCQAVGFELYPANEAFASRSVTALIPPKTLDEEALRNCMLSNHDIMIAGGFGELRGEIIRIGHMGPGITDEYIRATLEAIEACARKQGIDCPKGCAVAAWLGE
ncbi:MAG: aminotransferase class V-fold PLP-dependent enzyme, partial [Planctomycetota bacterium]|nr:aminotransferase class V-fold PLP-dependent enzyme [Planctomycetota bacterium]